MPIRHCKQSLLLVAGDLTSDHSEEAFDEFYYWFEAQEYTKKIYIAGNAFLFEEALHNLDIE